MDSLQTPPISQPKKDYTLVVILSFTTLLGTLIALFFYLQNQELRKQITASPSPTPLPSPTATSDSTANWKVYTNTKCNLSFKYDSDKYQIEPYSEPLLSKETNIKYPDSFTSSRGYKPPPVLGAIKIAYKDFSSVSHPADNAGVMQIWIFNNSSSLSIDQWYEKYSYYPIWGKSDSQTVSDKEKPMSNFVVDNIQGKGNYFDGVGKIKLGYISVENKMLLFYGRGINYDEKNNKEILPNEVSQILSTFKFTEAQSTPSATPKTIYTCPTNGWVDCMPVLDFAKQKACSTEAQIWYKTNCPNFQGIAL